MRCARASAPTRASARGFFSRGSGTGGPLFSTCDSCFLCAGIGYGGSCFPKDVKAIVETARDVGYDFRILKAVEAVNETQKRLLVDQIHARFGQDLKGRH